MVTLNKNGFIKELKDASALSYSRVCKTYSCYFSLELVLCVTVEYVGDSVYCVLLLVVDVLIVWTEHIISC